MKTCKQCGIINADDAKFCTNCGTAFAAETDEQPQEEYSSENESSLSPETVQPVQEEMGFIDAIKICFKKYATFKGRATRAEFWSFQILFSFVSIISVLFLFFLSSLTNLTVDNSIIGKAILLPFLCLLCPLFAVAARRLHDIGLSAGWWPPLGLIAFLGGLISNWIPILVGLIFFWFSIRESEEKDNKYGPFVNYKVKRSFYIALALYIAISVCVTIFSITKTIEYVSKLSNDISNEYVNMDDDISATTGLEEMVKERFDEIYEEDSLYATSVSLEQVDDTTYNGTININYNPESLPITVYYDGTEMKFEILE